MVQHPCSLTQIVEDEHGLYEKPADGDVLSAAVTQVGVKSLSTGGTEEHGTQNQEPLWRFCQQHGSIVGVEGLQNQWVRGDAESSRYAQQQEPYQHEYSERLADALCAKALHKEDDGDDAQCDGDDWQVGTDAFESFDGCGNRDGRGDDSICQQGAGTDDGQQVNPLSLHLAQQGVEGEDASFAIVVGTQRHAYVFDGGLQGECPDDARQCTQDGALVDGFTRVQDGLHHVEWGCTYISKHNAQSDEQSQEAYSMMAGY